MYNGSHKFTYILEPGDASVLFLVKKFQSQRRNVYIFKSLSNALKISLMTVIGTFTLLTEQTACNTTALIAAYKAYPPNGGSNSVPLGLCARCYPMRHGP